MKAKNNTNAIGIVLLLAAVLIVYTSMVLAGTSESEPYQSGHEVSATLKGVDMPSDAKPAINSCNALDIQIKVKRNPIMGGVTAQFTALESFLNRYPDTTAIIEGHTDDSGTSNENLQLSQHWADGVMNHLVEMLHISPARLSAIGYGDTRPIADNATQEGKQMNLRIDVVIVCAPDFVGLKADSANIRVAMKIEFDPTTSFIRPEYRAELAKVANFMKANPSYIATIEGSDVKINSNLELPPQLTNSSINRLAIANYLNMSISQNHATTVANYLVNDLGVARSRLATSAFGQSKKIVHNNTSEALEQNRNITMLFNQLH